MVMVNRENWISGDDHRLVESCLRVIRSEGPPIATTVQTGEQGAIIINQLIADKYSDRRQKDDYARSTLTQAKQNLLPESELDWFKKNDRACYWVWGSISRYQFFAAPNPPVMQLMQGQQPPSAPHYNQLNLKVGPSSSKERFDEVVKFFDRSGQPLDWQRSLVAHLKNQWGQIFSSRKPFSWLKQDDEVQVRWAWEYLSKQSVGLIGINRPTVFGFVPTGCREMYLAIYAAFDAWETIPDSKRLFLNDFNKAWQQKKHRNNREGKKVCNLVLRDEVKAKLDALAAQRGKKLNQLVEELIESEYANITKGSSLKSNSDQDSLF